MAARQVLRWGEGAACSVRPLGGRTVVVELGPLGTLKGFEEVEPVENQSTIIAAVGDRPGSAGLFAARCGHAHVTSLIVGGKFRGGHFLAHKDFGFVSAAGPVAQSDRTKNEDQ